MRANVYEALQREGIKIQGCLRVQGHPARIKQLAATPGVIGIHHYGVAADNWFRDGQFDYDRHSDQPAEAAALIRKYGAPVS
ncbi:MAG TPA: hypothetical protein VLH09_00510 [Bryobacteraceae bacterium]|nr:hypothetical protein [Bryobacteraceae bacterium]